MWRKRYDFFRTGQGCVLSGCLLVVGVVLVMIVAAAGAPYPVAIVAVVVAAGLQLVAIWVDAVVARRRGDRIEAGVEADTESESSDPTEGGT